MPPKKRKRSRRYRDALVSRYISRRDKTSRAYVTYLDLLEAAEYLRGEMSRQLAMFNLTTMQYRVLETLYRHGPQFQAPLSEKFRCSKQNVARVIEALERTGYVRRRASSLAPTSEKGWVNPKGAARMNRPEMGRRIQLVRLTRVGKEVMKQVFPKRAKVVKAEMSVLDGREQKTLSRLCRKLRQGDVWKFIREMKIVDAWE